MPGKPITISHREYYILSEAKRAYEESQTVSADWGQFLLFLLGLYISDLTKANKEKAKAGSSGKR